jgi:hypothetical protein
MKPRSEFASLEIMSHERAALARKEMEYWLAEADEWKRLKETPEELAGGIRRNSIGARNSTIPGKSML